MRSLNGSPSFMLRSKFAPKPPSMLQMTARPAWSISWIIFWYASAEPSPRPPWRWKSIAGNFARVMLVRGSFIKAFGIGGASGVLWNSGACAPPLATETDSITTGRERRRGMDPLLGMGEPYDNQVPDPQEVRAMKNRTRREFLGSAAAVSAFSIVPRRVLGGTGYLAPSDMIVLAQVGCGTQAQRQVNTGFVARPELQFVAVADPNRDSQNYVDWSDFGNRGRIRRFLEEPTWGEGDKGIRAGREVARGIMETYYKKHDRPGGIR